MLQKKQGQGLVEYIILVGLIALLVFGLVKAFGGEVGEKFKDSGDTIGGIDTSGTATGGY